jgi:RHS repeat-associated protein
VGPEVAQPVVSVSAPPVAAQGLTVRTVAVDGSFDGFGSGLSTEDVAARTPRSTVFHHPDGTSTLRVFDEVAFVRGAGGGFVPLDARLSARVGDGRLVPAAASAVSVAGSAADVSVGELALPGGALVAFGVDGAAPVAVVADGSVARFPGVRSDADIELSATGEGLKELIVLRSAATPRSWLFPLRTVGVEPLLDQASGAVWFVDRQERVVAQIPPGWMVDSKVDPRSGTGARSRGVTYTLVPRAGGWALRMDLDDSWLSSPARVYPVFVDPTFNTGAGTDDTYVSSHDDADQNNSGDSELLVGTYNSGGEKTASYLHFNSLVSTLANRYVLGATLSVYNAWSYSCTARPVTVHRVTASWAGSTATTWAGPAYEATALDSTPFSFGYTACPAGGWGTFDLPPDRVRAWVHGLESFYGLTLRASTSDSLGWKRFWSANYQSDPAKRPRLDVLYANEGAAYLLPTGAFSPAVTATSAGQTTVRVTNWGSTTWTPTNGYRLTYKVLNSGGSTVVDGPAYTMPGNVGPHQSADIVITVPAITGIGSYTLRLDMLDAAGSSFNTLYSVPFGLASFSTANGPPYAADVWPRSNGYVDSLTPTLWVRYLDPDNSSTVRQYQFQACASPTNCLPATGWIPSATWRVPTGLLTWGTQSYYKVKLSDGAQESAWSDEIYFTPVAAQPPVTSHLAGADDGADMPGVNPQVGNYTRTVVDAKVAVAGPALAVSRTYNSQDPRSIGAFGSGWSSPLDQRLQVDADGSLNVVVTLATGLQVRFGRNPNGTYAPPPGVNLTLVTAPPPATGWVLRDATGFRREFDASGRLSNVFDVDGRRQSYTYVGSQVSQITDVASGRTLHLTWTGSHVTSVATDPPTVGQPAPTWTYSYAGDKLTGACTPLAGSCTTYAYTTSSHYQATVLDDNPSGYWPLGEVSGSAAADAAARSSAEPTAAYSGTALGASGALAGSADTAATFAAPPGAGNGPVSAWDLSEASGATTAADSSGGGHPATLTGVTAGVSGRLLPSPAGAAPTVMSFNGTSSRAVTSGPVLTTNASFTVAAWVRSTDPSTTTYRTAVSQEAVSGSGFYLHKATDRWAFSRIPTDAPGTVYRAMSVGPPAVGAWTHLVGVYDHSAGQIRLYVDGVLQQSVAFTATWNATGALTIGRDKYAGVLGAYFAGDIAEVRVWQRALDATEIAPMAATLAGWWTTDMHGLDDSGYGRHTTPTGTPSYVVGQTSEAVHLSGSGQALDTAMSPVESDQLYTVSAWVRLSTTATSQVAVSQNGSLWSSFGLYYDAAWNRWAFSAPSADGSPTPQYVFSTAVPAVNTWTHLTGVYDRSAAQIRLYVGGVLQGSVSAAAGAFHGANGLHIGNSLTGSGTTGYWWSGDIDDVRVFAGVLPQTEITKLAGSGPPPASATTAVVLPTDEVNTSVAGAVELWFKAAAGTSGVLLGEQNRPLSASASRFAPLLYVGADGRLRGQAPLTSGAITPMTSTSVVTDSNWHHAVLTYGADFQQLYLDGASVGTPITSTIDHADMANAYVGNGRATGWPSAGSGTTFGFTGTIDDVAAYRHSLSAAQVNAHYAARLATNRLATVVEPGPFTAATVTYDGRSGRVSSLVDRHGATWTLSAPQLGVDSTTVTVSSSVSDAVSYTYDTRHAGRLVTRHDGFGDTTYAYGANGFLEWTTDPNGNQVRAITDSRGNVIERHTSRAGVWNIEYFGYYLNGSDPLDPRNDALLWSADARSSGPTDLTYRTTRTLDPAGRVTQITYPKPVGQSTNPTEAFTYTNGSEPAPAGLLATATARNGGVTISTYNGAGDLATSTDPVGLVTAYGYDALGRPTSTNRYSDVGGSHVDYGTTTITYNGLSQPLVVTAPAVNNPITSVLHTAVTTNTYDATGRRTGQTISDSTGGDTARTTTWGYDPAGRLVSVTAPDATVTTQEWNTAGDTIKVTKPGGLVLQYEYDDAHRLVTTTATGAGVDPQEAGATALVLERRSYDPGGRLASVVDAAGRETVYAYHADGTLDTMTALRTDLPGPPAPLVLEDRDYDKAGHPTTVTTAGGVVTTTTYDAAGYVNTRTLDPAGLGRVVAYSRNPDGSVHHSTATGAASPGRTERVDYSYDLAARLLTTTVDNTGGTPASLTTTMLRDPRGLVVRETDPTGIATNFSYDLAGQPLTTIGAARATWVGGTSIAGVTSVTTLGRNTFGDVTHQRDPNSNITTGTFDTMGRSTSITLPAYTPPGGSSITSTSSTTYNAMGLPATQTDALGRVTTLTYDKDGRLTTRTLPDPDEGGPKTAPQWTYAYDRVGQQLDALDPIGAHTMATFDSLGRQVTATRSDRIGETTVYFPTTLGYDDAGNLTTSTTPLGHATTVEHNKAGQPTVTSDATGRFVKIGYDLAGREASRAAGQNTTYVNPVATTTYDLAGRATSTSDCTATAGGACGTVLRTASTVYDAAGRRTQTTSPQGRPTFYGYDGAGQLTWIAQRVDPATPVTAVTVGLGYDPAGHRSHMVDGNGNATDYTHNPWGLVESTIEPSTAAHPDASDRTWTTSYDANGQPIGESVPGGVSRIRTFDGLGRLTTETGAGVTTAARQLDYDALGRLVSVSAPGTNLTYAWNDRDLLATSTGSAGSSSFTYDGDNLLISRTDPTGTATFTYDNGGRLSTMADPLTSVTATHSYDGAGRLSGITHGTGNATRTYTHDTLGRIATDVWLASGGATIASATYGYDTDDQLTLKTTVGVVGAGANSYTYDGLGRLATWTNPAAQTTTYTYDAASNRTGVANSSGTRTTTFDQRNRPLSAAGGGQPSQSWTWSPRGTMATDTLGGVTTTYTFDAFERMVSVAAGSIITYAYDGLDRLATRNGVSLGYADLTNTPVKNPASEADALISRSPSGVSVATKIGTGAAQLTLTDPVHADATASASVVGTVSASTTYDPWGAPTSSSGTTPVGYQGGFTDPDTGQVNAHARWYAPGLGAFTSRDTWTLEPDPLAQANRYAYANANPTTDTDSNGHFKTPTRDPSIGGGAGTVVIGPPAIVLTPRQAEALLVLAGGVGIYAGLTWWHKPDVAVKQLPLRSVTQLPSTATCPACLTPPVTDTTIDLTSLLFELVQSMALLCAASPALCQTQPEPCTSGTCLTPPPTRCEQTPCRKPILVTPIIGAVGAAVARAGQGVDITGGAGLVNNVLTPQTTEVSVDEGESAPSALGGGGTQPPPVSPPVGTCEAPSAPNTNYRRTFFEQNPNLGGKVVVHHAVEQQVLVRYPGLYSAAEIHDISRLRGIPKEVNNDLHLSKIRKLWNGFYRGNPCPTKEQVEAMRQQIDEEFGPQFHPPVE